MTQQIPLDASARVAERETHDGTHEVAPDLAYRRLVMVNVVFVGRPGAGDRNWVLVDAGVLGTKALIKGAADASRRNRSRDAGLALDPYTRTLAWPRVVLARNRPCADRWRRLRHHDP